MARNLTSGMVTAFTSNVVTPIFLAQIETAGGTIYAWSGYGTLTWNGINYNGTGTFGGVDTVTETSDLTATGVNFSLAGVDPALLSAALQDIRKGLKATLYLGALDSSLNLIADPYQLFQGTTDVPTVNEGPENACTITISAESTLINLERVLERRYTTQDQSIDYPGDLGFQYVPSLQNAVIRFG